MSHISNTKKIPCRWMSATASKTAERSAGVTHPVLNESLIIMIIHNKRVHTSDKGLLHDANNDTILGNVSSEIKEVVSYAHRLYKLLSTAFGGYICCPRIFPANKNINVLPYIQ